MNNKLNVLVNNLEEDYNSNGLKEYVRNILTKLSNNTVIVTDYDSKIISFRWVDANFYRFTMCIMNIVDNDVKSQIDNIENAYSYDIGHIGDTTIELRHIFSNNNLIDIVSIIEYTIKNKEIISNLEGQKADKLFEYLDCLIYNLKVLALFYFDENFEIDINIPLDEVIKIKDINDDLYDLDAELIKIQQFDEDDLISEEADDLKFKEEKELEKAKNKREFFKKIGSYALKIKTTINNGKNLINNFLDKFNIARNLFYKKYIGKIDSLYEHYSDEALILENKLHGDPTTILFNTVPEYISNLIKNTFQIYDNYNKHINKLFNTYSLSEMIKEINSYLTYEDVKLSDKSSVKQINKALQLDLRYKIAKILLEGNEVYGFTEESVVLKKYPNLNHLIVSLFIPLPHEKPIEQRVSDIFESAESFKILSIKFKDIILKISNSVNSKISSLKIDDDIKRNSLNIDKYKSNFKLNKSLIDNDKNDLKQRINVLSSHIHLLESFIPFFIYISNISTVIYNISTRIDYTARDAIKSMLNIERGKTDKSGKYKTGTVKSEKNEYKTSTNKNPEKASDTKNKLKNIKKEVTKNTKVDEGNKVTTYKFK